MYCGNFKFKGIINLKNPINPDDVFKIKEVINYQIYAAAAVEMHNGGWYPVVGEANMLQSVRREGRVNWYIWTANQLAMNIAYLGSCHTNRRLTHGKRKTFRQTHSCFVHSMPLLVSLHLITKHVCLCMFLYVSVCGSVPSFFTKAQLVIIL